MSNPLYTEYSKYIEKYLDHFGLKADSSKVLDTGLISQFIEAKQLGPSFNANVSVQVKRFIRFLFDNLLQTKKRADQTVASRDKVLVPNVDEFMNHTKTQEALKTLATQYLLTAMIISSGARADLTLPKNTGAKSILLSLWANTKLGALARWMSR